MSLKLQGRMPDAERLRTATADRRRSVVILGLLRPLIVRALPSAVGVAAREPGIGAASAHSRAAEPSFRSRIQFFGIIDVMA
jgi:hypothetical protein